jgi:xanthine dehydrogenase/oxidase
MTMTGFLANDPVSKTEADIEKLFDGNICRCTGYRSILEGMKTFASDWNPKGQMDCQIDPTFDAKSVAKKVEIPIAAGGRAPVQPAVFAADGKSWTEVLDLDHLQKAWGDAKKAGQKVLLINGHTSYGVYKDEVEAAASYIDIRNVMELRQISKRGDEIEIGAGVTYGELVSYLTALDPPEGSPIAALLYMAHRTAGTLVRNAATVGGNLMLMIKHILAGVPFPSDLATALLALEVQVLCDEYPKGPRPRIPLEDLISACAARKISADDLLVRSLILKSGANANSAVTISQKTALREVNSHSIVNSGSTITFEPGNAPVFKKARFVLGGIDAYPFVSVAVNGVLSGQAATPALMSKALSALEGEVRDRLRKTAGRRAEEPDEGFTDEYRTDLAVGLLYKALVNALEAKFPGYLPKQDRSAGNLTWGTWPVSFGTQGFPKPDPADFPMTQPFITLMALYQTQGEVRYTQETPKPQGTLYGALVTSRQAVGQFAFNSPPGDPKSGLGGLVAFLMMTEPDFQRLITAADVPAGGQLMQGMGSDQPLFLSENTPIMYSGQALGMVLARNQAASDRIAKLVTDTCVTYRDDTPVRAPVLGLIDAIDKKQFFPDYPQSASFVSHIYQIRRTGSDLTWARVPDQKLPAPVTFPAKIGGANCQVVQCVQTCGGQLHFYMETQAALALPEDGQRMLVIASTQSPKSVLDGVTRTLGWRQNQVGVRAPQLGGAYGGKTEQSKLPAAMAALGAFVTQKPVSISIPRATDSALFGHRHPFIGAFQLAVDDGSADPAKKGAFVGLSASMWGDGGAYYDCSFVVADCIQLRIDSGYFVPNYETTMDVCRTNTAANTAFRGFGDIQGTMMLENAIEEAAVVIGMDAAAVRRKNLYGQSPTGQDPCTPSGQAMVDCYMQSVWDHALTKFDYDARLKSITGFNAANRWRKRGICMMPVKYGSGFNLAMLEQTTAIVNIYPGDGTILINQGGVDMGQGMVTQLAQIAAHVLNVPISLIRIQFGDTRIIPNPSSTGASTGTAYNGRAIRNACLKLKKRLVDYYEGLPDDWNLKADPQKDGLRRPEGWRGPCADSTTPLWAEIVSRASADRVNLQAQAMAKVPGGTQKLSNGFGPGPIIFRTAADQPTATGIPVEPNGQPEEVDNYVGFSYNVACSEVEVDVLTGETKILRADIVYDMGKSLNPAVDIGQIEGAFMQGVGYVLSENIVRQPDGPEAGRLNTDNTWTYKPPAISTVPLEFNVSLFPQPPHIRRDPNALYSSKEVGEPPLVLANSVFFAVKSAVRASRRERGLSPSFHMSAPATVQTVNTACSLSWQIDG